MAEGCGLHVSMEEKVNKNSDKIDKAFDKIDSLRDEFHKVDKAQTETTIYTKEIYKSQETLVENFTTLTNTLNTFMLNSKVEVTEVKKDTAGNTEISDKVKGVAGIVITIIVSALVGSLMSK